jgi:[histone H3]-trimethyl-L-lysine9/36 demethylase
MNLYSVSYLHFGEPKTWYAIPPEFGRDFELFAKEQAAECKHFLRHKKTFLSPELLTQNGIPYDKITQEEGQFIVTFPYGYHIDFNYGFYYTEGSNFATQG